MTRVKGVDGTDAAQPDHGRDRGRRQIDDIVTYLVNYVPGLREGLLHEDGAVPRHPRDAAHRRPVRDDAGGRARLPAFRRRHRGGKLSDRHPSPGGRRLHADLVRRLLRHSLPLARSDTRSATCSSPDGSISATHEAMGAIRVMATCMAMGEAAGRAAKISVRGNRTPAEIDVEELRRQQLERGVYLRNPDGTRAQPMGRAAA